MVEDLLNLPHNESSGKFIDEHPAGSPGCSIGVDFLR